MPQKKNLRCQQPVISLEPLHGDSQTSLSPITAKWNQEEVGMLLRQEYINSDARKYSGRQLLSQAVERGDERQVELLLKDRRLEPHSTDTDCTPLILVVKSSTPISKGIQRK
jgi:ankyrin repeat protein